MTTMEEMQPHLEQLIALAQDCETRAQTAGEPEKRILYRRLASHYRVMATEVANAIARVRRTTRTQVRELRLA